MAIKSTTIFNSSPEPQHSLLHSLTFTKCLFIFPSQSPKYSEFSLIIHSKIIYFVLMPHSPHSFAMSYFVHLKPPQLSHRRPTCLHNLSSMYILLSLKMQSSGDSCDGMLGWVGSPAGPLHIKTRHKYWPLHSPPLTGYYAITCFKIMDSKIHYCTKGDKPRDMVCIVKLGCYLLHSYRKWMIMIMKMSIKFSFRSAVIIPIWKSVCHRKEKLQ